MQKTPLDSFQRGLSNGTKYATHGALLEKLLRDKGEWNIWGGKAWVALAR